MDLMEWERNQNRYRRNLAWMALKKKLTLRYNGFAGDEGTRALISKGQTEQSGLDLGIAATLFSTGDSFVAIFFLRIHISQARAVHTYCLTRHPLNSLCCMYIATRWHLTDDQISDHISAPYKMEPGTRREARNKRNPPHARARPKSHPKAGMLGAEGEMELGWKSGSQ